MNKRRSWLDSDERNGSNAPYGGRVRITHQGPGLSAPSRGVYDPGCPEQGLRPIASSHALPWMDEDLDLLEPPVPTDIAVTPVYENTLRQAS
jgi:hypothetical protein